MYLKVFSKGHHRIQHVPSPLQAEHREDPNLASRQIEHQKADTVERLQRVKALGLHLNHNKRVAETEHKCCTCNRALSTSSELQTFLSKQV